MLGGGVRADVSVLQDSPYRVILDRNPFGLKPPPTNVVQPPTNPAVAVDIKLSGITRSASGKKAWLVIPAKPGKQATDKYLSLAEGDQDGALEVVEINEQENSVKVLNAGAPVVLTFAEHGLKAPVAAATPPAPGHQRPGQPTPVPTIPQPAVKTASMNPTLPQGNPAMAARYGLNPAGAASQEVVVDVAERGASSLRTTIPARNIRTAMPEPMPEIDPAVQAIQMKAWEAKARAEGVAYPPLPPIPGMPQ